jgi:hypothetical protein
LQDGFNGRADVSGCLNERLQDSFAHERNCGGSSHSGYYGYRGYVLYYAALFKQFVVN